MWQWRPGSGHGSVAIAIALRCRAANGSFGNGQWRTADVRGSPYMCVSIRAYVCVCVCVWTKGEKVALDGLVGSAATNGRCCNSRKDPSRTEFLTTLPLLRLPILKRMFQRSYEAGNTDISVSIVLWAHKLWMWLPISGEMYARCAMRHAICCGK